MAMSRTQPPHADGHVTWISGSGDAVLAFRWLKPDFREQRHGERAGSSGDAAGSAKPDLALSNVPSARTKSATSAPRRNWRIQLRPRLPVQPIRAWACKPGARAASESGSSSNQEKLTVSSTNKVGRTVASGDGTEVTMGIFDLQLVQFLQRIIKWTYLLLVLLLLAYLVFRLWQWEKRRMKQQLAIRSKR
jgi:hypothetical protein